MDRKTLDSGIVLDARQLSPEAIAKTLTYRNYAYNRDLGMTAEGARRVYGEQAAVMEVAYQVEKEMTA